MHREGTERPLQRFHHLPSELFRFLLLLFDVGASRGRMIYTHSLTLEGYFHIHLSEVKMCDVCGNKSLTGTTHTLTITLHRLGLLSLSARLDGGPCGVVRACCKRAYEWLEMKPERIRPQRTNK